MNESEPTKAWINPTGAPGLASILIPAYNAAETIAATLDSVARQTHRPIEVVIIDDGSTDQTDTLIRGWIKAIGQKPDFTVRYFKQANQGLLACRNRSTRESRGEFVQYLDADDLLHPDKLKISIASMTQNPAVDVVISRTLKFWQEQELAGKLKPSPATQPWTKRETNAPIIGHAFWYTPGPVFRRRAVTAAGPFPLDVHPVAEELEFHARIKCTTKHLRYLPEIMAFHRTGLSHQLTRQLPRLYQGKVDGVRWVAKIMEQHNITDRREWRGLINDLSATAYAIATCSYDPALFEESVRLLKDLARRHWGLMSWVFRLFSPNALSKLCKWVSLTRKGSTG